MADLRAARQLAAEIPEKGATLYDLLNKEVELKVRTKVSIIISATRFAGASFVGISASDGVERRRTFNKSCNEVCGRGNPIDVIVVKQCRQ